MPPQAGDAGDWLEGDRLDGCNRSIADCSDDDRGDASSSGTGRRYPLDPETGQGDAHVAFAFAAHRAVVDVDVELGLVRVVEIATAQDVGKAMNPQALEGQIEGGIAQGLGLALMEEIQVRRRPRAQPVLHRLPDPDGRSTCRRCGSTCSSSPTPTRRTG